MDYEALEADGLIFTARVAGITGGRRVLSRDEGRGLLLALRRGVFVRREVWDGADPREQHVLRVRAVVASADRPVVVAGLSAAAIWGMPVSAPWPADVMLLEERHGGGHREPGVRRTSIGALTAIPVDVGGISSTALARTALDVARRASFAEAIGSVDWALWRKNPAAIDREALFAEVDLLRAHKGFHHLARLAGFATPLSDSFGESRARAVIHLLGFSAPELQVEFRDPQGLIVPDFFWPSVRVAGEFDGKVKYTRDEYTHGDPSETVWREKRREDRLRRTVAGVVRIADDGVAHPNDSSGCCSTWAFPATAAVPGGVNPVGRSNDPAQLGASPPATAGSVGFSRD
ncbi:MAG: hypothetical protein WDM88_03740 [Galbitalea sp.]